MEFTKQELHTLLNSTRVQLSVIYKECGEGIGKFNEKEQEAINRLTSVEKRLKAELGEE